MTSNEENPVGVQTLKPNNDAKRVFEMRKIPSSNVMRVEYTKQSKYRTCVCPSALHFAEECPSNDVLFSVGAHRNMLCVAKAFDQTKPRGIQRGNRRNNVAKVMTLNELMPKGESNDRKKAKTGRDKKVEKSLRGRASYSRSRGRGGFSRNGRDRRETDSQDEYSEDNSYKSEEEFTEDETAPLTEKDMLKMMSMFQSGAKSKRRPR
uniref:RNA-binding protein n=1 Tax=Rice gall dwarf virus TaxID=10986 RepID=A5X2H6_RGDV|nr:p12 [Rice gall dwarf virus]